MRIRAAWYLLIMLYVCDLIASEKRPRLFEPTPEELLAFTVQLDRDSLQTQTLIEPVEREYKCAEKQYHDLLHTIEKLPPLKQQEKMGAFFKTIMQPLNKKVKEQSAYDVSYWEVIVSYNNLLADITSRQLKANFCIDMQYVGDSAENFTQAYTRYNLFSDKEQREFEHFVPQFWNAALQYGSSVQVKRLSSAVFFSATPDHIDAVYACMLRYPVDEQITLVSTLFKNFSGFAAYIENKKKDQNSIALPIFVRNCIAHNQSELLLDSFKDKDGRVIDQFFMNLMQPLLIIKKARYQDAVVNALAVWSGTVCLDDKKYLHSNYEKALALVSKDGCAFKRLLESDVVGVAVTQWWAKLQVFIWNEYAAKKDSNKLFDPMKKKSLSLMKGIESAFVRISSELAITFHHTDNNVIATMHGGILCLLLSEGNTTKEKAYALCERALKSGINIAEEGYMRYITSALPDSSLFLKLVEPYSDNNLDVCYALGQLYENGYFIKMDKEAGKNKVDVWLKRDVKKAKELYIKMLEKGDTRAVMRWLSLTHESAKSKSEEEQSDVHYYTIQLLSGLCERFPSNLLLRAHRAHFICKCVSEITKDTINERAVVYMDELEKEIKFIASNLTTLCPYFASLKASYKALNYTAQKSLCVSIDQQSAMVKLARCTYATYTLSAYKNFFLLPVISNYFDTSVFAHLRCYAEKLLNKDPKVITEEELDLLATAGYTVLHTHNEQGLGKDDKIFIDKIIRLSSHKDMQIQWPPIMHIIALYDSSDQNDSNDTFWQHIKTALQEGEIPENIDPVAQYEAEQKLEMWSKGGSALAQMYLLKHNKNALMATVKKLLLMQKPLVGIAIKSISDYVKNIEECGGYALLKTKLLESKCVECCADMRALLISWLMAFILQSESKVRDMSKHPELKPFFDDIKLFKIRIQQE